MGDRAGTAALNDPDSTRSRGPLVLGLGLLVLYGCLCVGVAATLPDAVDERGYTLAGRALCGENPFSHRWEVPIAVAQAPFGLYLNQTFGPEASQDDDLAWLLRARLGLIPWALLGAALAFLWSRRLHGGLGGLVTLILLCGHPLVIGYGSLVNVDLLCGTMVTAALLVGWRFVDTSHPVWAAALGAALGLAIGTKFLMLLLIPVAMGVLVAGSWTRRAGVGRVVRRLGVSLVLFGAGLLLALHGAYRFEAMFAADVSTLRSDLIRGVADLPGIGLGLSLLPGPFVHGLDMMLGMDEGGRITYCNGEWSATSFDYYFWSLVRKTPEVLLLMLGIGLVLAVPGFRGAPRSVRNAGWVLLAGLAFPVLWLSFASTLKVGVRYVLPYYPALCVLLGVVGRRLESWRLGVRVSAAGLVLVLLALEIGGGWPNLLAYFNRSSGGPAQGYRYFRDSNCDFGQLRDPGIEMLRERFGDDLATLGSDEGPRFGRFAIYLTERIPRDLLNWPDARHWLDPFEPVDHVDAAWWVYDLDEESFQTSLEDSGDARIRRDLVVALMGADQLDRAEEHMVSLDPVTQKPLAAHLKALRRPRLTDANRLRLARGWIGLGRHDRALETLAPIPHDGEETWQARTLIAECHVQRGNLEAAVEVLSDDQLLRKSPVAINTLMLIYKIVGAREPELDRLQQILDSLPEPSPRNQKALDRLRDQTRDRNVLWQARD